VHTFFYRVLVVLIPAFFCPSVLSQDRDALMFANIATRMVENGRTDNDRLYLFYFSYSDFGQVECNVRTLVISNLTCSKTSGVAALPFTAPWIASPGFCDQRYCPDGVGRFSCARKALGDGKFEYTFRVPAGLAGGYSSHQLIMQTNPYTIEYSGSLSNYTDLDRTIKSAKYVPLVSTSEKYWLQEVDLGCSRIAVPAIRRK